MTMSEIKFCPHCDGQPVIGTGKCLIYYGARISCKFCGASTRFYTSKISLEDAKQQAIKAWNRRDSPANRGQWVYWEGWIGNHDQRIDDATCKDCGYKHPTVRWRKGDERNSTPDKLANYCPNCGLEMFKR